MAKFKPDIFEYASLGLPNFDEISIIWEGNGLTRYRGGEERAFYPSEEDWENFWNTLDKIDAWSWRGEYINKSILDGEEWTLKIIYEGKQLNCCGSNSYPPGFEEFTRAINALIFQY